MRMSMKTCHAVRDLFRRLCGGILLSRHSDRLYRGRHGRHGWQRAVRHLHCVGGDAQCRHHAIADNRGGSSGLQMNDSYTHCPLSRIFCPPWSVSCSVMTPLVTLPQGGEGILKHSP